MEVPYHATKGRPVRPETSDVEYLWTVTVRLRGSSARVHVERCSSDGVTADCFHDEVRLRLARGMASWIDDSLDVLWDEEIAGGPF